MTWFNFRQFLEIHTPCFVHISIENFGPNCEAANWSTLFSSQTTADVNGSDVNGRCVWAVTGERFVPGKVWGGTLACEGGLSSLFSPALFTSPSSPSLLSSSRLPLNLSEQLGEAGESHPFLRLGEPCTRDRNLPVIVLAVCIKAGDGSEFLPARSVPHMLIKFSPVTLNGDFFYAMCVGVEWCLVLSAICFCLSVTTFKMPENPASVLDAQVIGPTTEHLIESDFPEQSFKPKVQIAFQTLPGQCPRSIEIERWV